MCLDFFVLFFSGPSCGSKMAKSCEIFILITVLHALFWVANPLAPFLGEARGPFVATYVVLKLLLLYRRMVLQLHTVFGVGEGSCLFLFLFGSFAFFTMAFPMRHLTRLVAVRYFLTCTLLKNYTKGKEQR